MTTVDELLSEHRSNRFDLVMSRDDQLRWLTDLSYVDLSGHRLQDPDLRLRYTPRYQKYLSLPQADEVTLALRAYVQRCIPVPYRAELSFWNISCLTSGWLGALRGRLNLGGQSVFDVNVDPSERMLWAMWYLRESQVEEIVGIDLDFTEETEIPVIPYVTSSLTAHEVAIIPSDLTKGGTEQVFVQVRGLESVIAMIHDNKLLRAVREFNMGLVRKGPCMWQSNHCLDLADHLLEPDDEPDARIRALAVAGAGRPAVSRPSGPRRKSR